MEGFIQIVILVCLIVIILLLSVDKIKIIRSGKSRQTGNDENKPEAIPDIMGKPIVTAKDRNVDHLINRKRMMERLIREKSGNVTPAVAQEVETVEKPVERDREDDFDEDDEAPPDDDRFGQGISLEELTKVGNMLQQDSLDSGQEKETAEIIQKMQGTEFFSGMQDSIEGASQKIAKLLDKSLSQNHAFPSASSKSSDMEQFDIGDFI